MLPGPSVDLRAIEPSDIPLLALWLNDIDFNGEFERFDQASVRELETDVLGGDVGWLIVQKKDGSPVGFVNHGRAAGRTWIGYALVPGERGHGYASEAVQLLVDYLFLHRDISRIQAETHPDNRASGRVLERVGFRREGRLRQVTFSRGVWRDTVLYSIVRDDWHEPKLLPLGHVERLADPS